MGLINKVIFFSVMLIILAATISFGYSYRRERAILSYIISPGSSSFEFSVPTATPTPTPTYPKWTGEDLVNEINSRRVASGVSALTIHPDLCALVNKRMSDLVGGNLMPLSDFADREDNVEGFSNFSTIWEFRTNYSESAFEAINSWEGNDNNVVLRGGEYLWGCAVSDKGFGVLFATY